MGLGIDKDLLPGLDELPESGEGSRSDFESNPPGLDSPRDVVDSLKDDGIDPFDLGDKGQAAYAEGALREVQYPQRDERDRTAAQIEAEHDLVAAFGRTEFDDFGVEDFPGPEDP
jgi:hypothetical protein